MRCVLLCAVAVFGLLLIPADAFGRRCHHGHHRHHHRGHATAGPAAGSCAAPTMTARPVPTAGGCANGQCQPRGR